MLFFLAGFAHAAEAVPPARQLKLDIPAQPLGDALYKLAQQAGLQLVYRSRVAKGLQSPPLVGTFTPQAALDQLLQNTGLRFEYLDPDTVAIFAAQSNTATPSNATPAEVGQKLPPTASVDSVQRSDAAAGHLAGESHTAANSSERTSNEPVPLEEILVTAQKRTERLQDVPIPVTAISGDSLNDNNQLRLQDLYSRVPTLNFTVGLRGEPAVAIRGMTTTWSGNPTVGIVVDDVPYGASTANGGGFTAPDIDPSDLARLEVLRGPQGTLYGASSLGGLLKYVTVDPSTAGVSGRLQAGVSGVYNGNDLGYNVRGAVNVPLSDTLAVRASAFTRRDPGYIDDPALGLRGINWGTANGGRLSTLWQPSDTVSLKVNALIQNKDRRGSPEVDLLPGLGDLQQDTLRDTGDYSIHTRLYTATLKAKIASADLTVLSGYNDNSWSSNIDDSAYCGGAGLNFSGSFFNVPGCSLPENARVRKFTEEIRLGGSAAERVDWLVGAFYTHEKTNWVQGYAAIDPATGESVGSILDYRFGPTIYQEYAGFADVTYHFTDQFNIQVGGRESENKQAHDESGSGPLFGEGHLYVAPTLRTQANAFTYLLTPQFKLSQELMLYARLASGYRPGGPNVLAGYGHFPSSVRPDRSQNYEIGTKGDFLDHTLSFEASVYYIDWKDIQIPVQDPATKFNYTANAGRAKSQGVDLSVEARPLSGLTLSGWIAWNDAKLTEAFPAGAVYGAPGDRLPFSSRISGNISANQQFPVTNSTTAFVGGTISYVGDREGIFTASPVRQSLPGYAQVDLLTGARHESWTLNLFATNITDRRGVLAGGIGTSNPVAFIYTQPRTVGVSVSRDF